MAFPGGSVAKNRPAMQETQVRSLGQEDPLEKEMATHSSIPAWRSPWTEDPDITPVFLPGESQGWGSLVGCRLWGHAELDTTDAVVTFTLILLFP